MRTSAINSPFSHLSMGKSSFCCCTNIHAVLKICIGVRLRMHTNKSISLIILIYLYKVPGKLFAGHNHLHADCPRLLVFFLSPVLVWFNKQYFLNIKHFTVSCKNKKRQECEILNDFLERIHTKIV